MRLYNDATRTVIRKFGKGHVFGAHSSFATVELTYCGLLWLTVAHNWQSERYPLVNLKPIRHLDGCPTEHWLINDVSLDFLLAETVLHSEKQP